MSEENERPEPCKYCDGCGYHSKRKENLAEELSLCLPCFMCEGRGHVKEDGYHQVIDSVVVTDATHVTLNPDTFCPRRKVRVEFNLNYEAQQDGRPASKHWCDAKHAYNIGKKVLHALKNIGVPYRDGWGF
jgi:hypothetical protein